MLNRILFFLLMYASFSAGFAKAGVFFSGHYELNRYEKKADGKCWATFPSPNNKKFAIEGVPLQNPPSEGSKIPELIDLKIPGRSIGLMIVRTTLHVSALHVNLWDSDISRNLHGSISYFELLPIGQNVRVYLGENDSGCYDEIGVYVKAEEI